MRSWDDYKKTMQSNETLWTAAKSGQLHSISYFVNHGADLNERDHRGYSPLMLAVYGGQQEAAALLLDLGADANSSDFSGNSILMGAAFKGHLELARLLLESGADPTVRNSSGMTAFDFANTFGRSDVMDLLRTYHSHAEPVSRAVGFFKILLSRFQKSKSLRVPNEA